MRAPNNGMVDLYYGPGSPGGGGLKASAIPSRIVVDAYFREVDAPYEAIVAYCAFDQSAGSPAGPSWSYAAGGLWTADFSMADRLSSSTGSPPDWIVARVETCIPTVGNPYYRLHLVAEYVAEDVGCEYYSISPWGLLVYRIAPLQWSDGTGDTILSTDGEGHWEVFDVADDLHYVAASWDGTGTQEFEGVEQPEVTIDVACGD